MAEFRVIRALRAKAIAEREQALMALELLTEKGVGIGDHTANDFFNDAETALQRLVDAEDKLNILEIYFPDHGLMEGKYE
jgi:hypothetical protein